MIDPNSRYATLAQSPLVWTDAQGRDIKYVPRRFLAPAGSFETLAEVTVQGGERLDLISARTLGSAEAWWRVADANETLDPMDLISQPGRRIRVPVPRA
ncbi:MAG: LysM domain-containing protein [Polyangiaceae bacterium]